MTKHIRHKSSRAKPRRTRNGRFAKPRAKGETLSETMMPAEYAKATRKEPAATVSWYRRFWRLLWTNDAIRR